VNAQAPAAAWVEMQAREIVGGDRLHERFALVSMPAPSHSAVVTLHNGKLRPATPDDAPAIAALTERTYKRWIEIIGVPPAPVGVDYAAMLADPATWDGWVIPSADGGLDACLILEVTLESFEVWNIAVDVAAAGKGMGRMLMLFAERRARERGYREIGLYTNIRMVTNRAFYGRLGYEETGRRSIGGRQAVVMTKRLDGTRMTPMTTDHFAARRAAYRRLHETGCFVQPNPWDAGTARWLRGKGFPALATTSAGFAWSRGYPDQDVPLDLMLGHIADIVEAVPDLPVNADFENGYADDEDTLARNVKLCVATGVAGLSIEDATGRADQPLYDLETAVRRFKAARRVVDETGAGVMLTARAEAFLHGHPDPLPEVCRRLAAFAEAGADVLYAPGPRTKAEMRAIIAAAGGKPVNIIVFSDIGMTVSEIAELGARRISIGSALAKAAFTGFAAAAEELAQGSFAGFAGSMAGGPINAFFDTDRKERGRS
jgi:2-methylisocitrate lyase-like PEP mutase family enzyme/GNAT superfamily N-acetyltransferase